jgi:hypothetical protein
MNRVSLEHIIRAASAIVRQDDIVVIGSQALLGQFPKAPDELLVSMALNERITALPADKAELAGSRLGAIR